MVGLQNSYLLGIVSGNQIINSKLYVYQMTVLKEKKMKKSDQN